MTARSSLDIRPSVPSPALDAEPASLRLALAGLRARAAAAGVEPAARWRLLFPPAADPDAPQRILAAGLAARPGALLRRERVAGGVARLALLWLEDGSPLARSLGAAPTAAQGWRPGPEERIAAAARLCDGVAMRLGFGRGAVRLAGTAAILPLRRLGAPEGGVPDRGAWSAETPAAPFGRSAAAVEDAAVLAARLAQDRAPALVAAVENGVLVAALPPLARFDDFRELVFALDETAAALEAPVLLDGPPAPPDALLRAAAVRVGDDGLTLRLAPAPPGAVVASASPVPALWTAAAAEAGPMLSAELALCDPASGPGSRIAARADAAARVVAALLARPGLAALLGGGGPRSLLAFGPAQAAALDLALAEASQPRGATASARWRSLAQALAGADLRAEDRPSGGALVWSDLAPPADPAAAACVEAVSLALLAQGARERFVARVPAWCGGPADRWLLPAALWPDAVAALADAPPEAAALAPWLRRAFDRRFALIGVVETPGLRLSARRAVAPAPGALRIELLLEGPLADCAGLWVGGRSAPLRPGGVGGTRFCGVVWAPGGPGDADRRATLPLAVAVAPAVGGPVLLAAVLETTADGWRLSPAAAAASFGSWRPSPDPRQPMTLDLRLPAAP